MPSGNVLQLQIQKPLLDLPHKWLSFFKLGFFLSEPKIKKLEQNPLQIVFRQETDATKLNDKLVCLSVKNILP